MGSLCCKVWCFQKYSLLGVGGCRVKPKSLALHHPNCVSSSDSFVLLYCFVLKMVRRENQLRFFFVFLSLFGIGACWQNAEMDEAVVQTSYGPVRGTVNDTARSFKASIQRCSWYDFLKGIPFAGAPVGNNRWSNPIPPTPWKDVLNATQYSPGCPQRCVLPPRMHCKEWELMVADICPTTQDEDCLCLMLSELTVFRSLSQRFHASAQIPPRGATSDGILSWRKIW